MTTTTTVVLTQPKFVTQTPLDRIFAEAKINRIPMVEAHRHRHLQRKKFSTVQGWRYWVARGVRHVATPPCGLISLALFAIGVCVFLGSLFGIGLDAIRGNPINRVAYIHLMGISLLAACPFICFCRLIDAFTGAKVAIWKSRRNLSLLKVGELVPDHVFQKALALTKIDPSLTFELAVLRTDVVVDPILYAKRGFECGCVAIWE